MKWIKAKVEYDALDLSGAKNIISELFYKYGMNELEIEEAFTKDPLDYYSDEKLFFLNKYSISGYFPLNRYSDSKKNVLQNELSSLRNEDLELDLKFIEMDENTWKDSWKDYFLPEKISERVVVKPTWKDYDRKENEIIVEIDPGMAFGTGTHPTTFLCVQMLEKYIKKDMKILDVGTGSGILMIIASKLGSKNLAGIDIDENAVKVAKDNLELNSIKEAEYRLFHGDLIKSFKEEKFDLVVANILAHVIILLLEDISKVIKKGGIFIASGIIENEFEKVKSKIESKGFEIIEVKKNEEWYSIVGRY